MTPKENSILIADPFLKDHHFSRSVIYLCSHDTEGSFGLKLNELFDHTLGELINGLEDIDIPVFVGGPVGVDTLHFLHQCPDMIPDAHQLSTDIFWGGDFEVVKALIREQKIDLQKIKFFIGYSGWGESQLDHEMKEKSWLVVDAISSLVFNVSPDEVWKESVKLLGSEYQPILNYPIDPQLN